MKKIYITKTDKSQVVVHKILSCPDDDIVLYVPKNSLLTADAKNFKLLKREISAVGKKVTVESVDPNALELASVCGFEVADAIFKRTKVPLMDIMPASSKLHENGSVCRNPDITNIFKRKEEEDVVVGKDDEEEVQVVPGRVGDAECPEETEVCDNKERARPLPKITVFFSVVAVIAGLIWLGFFVLPKADIRVVMKKADWVFSGNVTASSGTSSVSADNSAVPAELFKISKNGTYAFKASGSKMVENKASGKLTIYNAYSSDPQPLVKNTRFVTPEGKIFRITAAVTVPGAKIAEGKINPSSVEVAVVADEPGSSYNVSMVAKMRIPGFQGTPKYDGFYGELKEGANGGYIGELKVPTDDDIKNAEEVSKRNVEEVLKAQVEASVPTGFMILGDCSDISVVKSGMTREADDKGEFLYTVMLESRVIAFREADMLSLMKERFGKEHQDSFDIGEYTFSYGKPVVDFSAGRMILPVEFSSKWARSFDADKFRAEAAGKSGSELKALIFSVPGMESGKADLWPIWVRGVPGDPDKIKVTAE